MKFNGISREELIRIISSGGVVVMPTDTVYGIFTKPSSAAGIEKIYEIKGRGKEKPLILLIPDVSAAWDFAEKTPLNEKYASEKWPGGVTLIMRSLKGGTIGLRLPDFLPLREIMRETGPLYATSANSSGEPAPRKFSDVSAEIIESSEAAVESSVELAGTPSEIIDISSGEARVLRSG